MIVAFYVLAGVGSLFAIGSIAVTRPRLATALTVAAVPCLAIAAGVLIGIAVPLWR